MVWMIPNPILPDLEDCKTIKNLCWGTGVEAPLFPWKMDELKIRIGGQEADTDLFNGKIHSFDVYHGLHFGLTVNDLGIDGLFSNNEKTEENFQIYY